MTRPDRSTEPPEPAGPPRDPTASSDPGAHVQADPLGLDPLSPIAAPDPRWFIPAHGLS